MDEFTRKFNAAEDKEQQVHHILTYITNHNSARSLICKIDRDELLQVLVKSYLEL